MPARLYRTAKKEAQKVLMLARRVTIPLHLAQNNSRSQSLCGVQRHGKHQSLALMDHGLTVSEKIAERF
jgi:hypothetical protein